MIFLPLPADYSFESTILAHGWYQLAPFVWDADTKHLQYYGQLHQAIYQLKLYETTADESPPNPDFGDKNVTHGNYTYHQSKILAAELEVLGGEVDENTLLAHLRWMLRLDDDLTEFYALCQTEPKLQHVAQQNGGRLLRSATVWEDVIKTLTTTNTAWSGTKRMCQRLVDNWGEGGAFPSPATLAHLDPSEFKEKSGLGYRAGYVQEIAQAVLAGQLDLESLKTTELDTQGLYKFLRNIKGVGDYAATSLLMLLGHYAHVPIDSIARSEVSRTFYGGEPVTPDQIRACFARFGGYAGLAYWCWNFKD